MKDGILDRLVTQIGGGGYSYCLFVCLFVCLFGFNVAFNINCHITTVSGCDRELNAHFYSAASLWYQIPDTFT